MRAAGIIAECNPLHEGHEYLIQKARERTGADYVVVAMSGDYVQRGAPSILSREIRAEALLRAGVDLVVELPLYVSSSGADYFARGGVALLESLGVITDLVFGSESGDLASLQAVAGDLLLLVGVPLYFGSDGFPAGPEVLRVDGSRADLFLIDLDVAFDLLPDHAGIRDPVPDRLDLLFQLVQVLPGALIVGAGPVIILPGIRQVALRVLFDLRDPGEFLQIPLVFQQEQVDVPLLQRIPLPEEDLGFFRLLFQ